jgi:hypothetical protein
VRAGDRQRISGKLRRKFMSVPGSPEIHVSPRIAGNSLSVPGHYIIRGKLAAKFSHMRGEFIEMPGSDGAC